MSPVAQGGPCATRSPQLWSPSPAVSPARAANAAASPSSLAPPPNEAGADRGGLPAPRKLA